MMTSLAAQIIDQQVSGIVERHADLLAGELRLGNDEQKMRSAAFVFLAARTAFDLTDREAFDGIVDGADDFGVDALYFDPPENGELPIVLIQGKYRSDLEEMGVALAGLDHRNFARARQLIKLQSSRYLSRAERQIDAALGSLFGGRARTLQRLAAAFRRADLVDLLETEAEERR